MPHEYWVGVIQSLFVFVDMFAILTMGVSLYGAIIVVAEELPRWWLAVCFLTFVSGALALVFVPHRSGSTACAEVICKWLGL